MSQSENFQLSFFRRFLFRAILGFVISPLVPGVLVIAIDTVVNGYDPNAVSYGIWFFRLLAVISYIVEAVFVVPIVFLLIKFNRTSMLIFLIFGLLGGICFYVGFVSLSGQLKLFVSTIFENGWRLGKGSWAIGTAAALGTIQALCFWIIARPDVYSARKKSN